MVFRNLDTRHYSKYYHTPEITIDQTERNTIRFIVIKQLYPSKQRRTYGELDWIYEQRCFIEKMNGAFKNCVYLEFLSKVQDFSDT